MNPPSFFAASLQVALGGALGAWLRYGAGLAVSRSLGPDTQFPWATLGVNVLGSLAMGLLAGWLARQGGGGGGESWRLLLGVGLLGGFTTFSAFSLELAVLVQRGALGMALAYAAISVVAGLAALFAGLALVRVAA